MKKIFILMFLLLYFTLNVYANPIVPLVFSEIYFDDNNDWTIELYDYYEYSSGSLDSCYLRSSSDTAYFNNGIIFDWGDTILVTNEDMQTDFSISRNGDFLEIDGYFYDLVSWYNFSPSYNQSLARVIFCPENNYPDPVFCLAKENQPSLGFIPFQVQTYGTLWGYVYDINGEPVENAEIILYPDNLGSYGIQTNGDGFFQEDNLRGITYYLTVEINYNEYIDTTMTIEPDMITFVELYTDYDPQSLDPSPQENNFSISNHPNPFYDETSIQYSFPKHTTGTITIFNSKGQKVKDIPVSPTENYIIWTGLDKNNKKVPSGVYFYQLESENKTLASGKMLYLR